MPKKQVEIAEGATVQGVDDDTPAEEVVTEAAPATEEASPGAPGANDSLDPIAEPEPEIPTVANTDPGPGVFVAVGVSGINQGGIDWAVDPETGCITGTA